MARHAHARARLPGRRARIGAALGLVVGAAIAVISTTSVAASWVDGVYGGAQFTTSPFGFESTVDGGGTWAIHPDTAPAVLALSAGNLVPSQSTYGAVSLRTVAGSPSVAVTIDGTSASAGLGGVLQYAVIRSATCDAAAFSAPGAVYVVGGVVGVPLSTNSATGAVVLPAGGVSTPGSAVPLCFRSTLPDTLAVWTTTAYRSTSYSATWTFLGSS